MVPMLLTLTESATDLVRDPQWAAGWGTLALINAGLAQGKHRSGLGWFLLSVFFGPFATLLVVLMDDPTEREE